MLDTATAEPDWAGAGLLPANQSPMRRSREDHSTFAEMSHIDSLVKLVEMREAPPHIFPLCYMRPVSERADNKPFRRISPGLCPPASFWRPPTPNSSHGSCCGLWQWAGREFLRRCKVGVLQYVVIQIVCTVIITITTLAHVYHEVREQ